jgi:hypothetical protein
MSTATACAASTPLAILPPSARTYTPIVPVADASAAAHCTSSVAVQLARTGRVGGGDVVMAHLRAAGGRQAGHVVQVLDRDRHAVQLAAPVARQGRRPSASATASTARSRSTIMRLILRGGAGLLLRTVTHARADAAAAIEILWALLHPGGRRLHPSTIPTTCKDTPWTSEQP